MADFRQQGRITTFHDLARRPVEALEADLTTWTASQPLTLVIPCLATELERPAIDGIIDELRRVPYLDRVVIGLDQADAVQAAQAQRRFGVLPQPTTMLWLHGPEMEDLRRELASRGFAIPAAGKGQNLWWTLGLVSAGSRRVIAVHDADIVNYSRRLLARLVFPVLHPALGYRFAKGYYYRASDGRLQGRATRLFVWPLLQALRAVVGEHAHLTWLDGFRYPLAGEVAFRSDLTDHLSLAADWSVDLGLLAEVERAVPADQVCQVEIADGYDHKHQALSSDDPSSGLHRMAIDITSGLLGRLAADGHVLSTEHVRALRATYVRTARELVDRYHDDAVVNGFVYDRAGELGMVEVFNRAIDEAGVEHRDGLAPDAALPRWNTVRDLVPGIDERLRDLAQVAAVDR